jgi:hypothetical protein
MRVLPKASGDVLLWMLISRIVLMKSRIVQHDYHNQNFLTWFPVEKRNVMMLYLQNLPKLLTKSEERLRQLNDFNLWFKSL